MRKPVLAFRGTAEEFHTLAKSDSEIPVEYIDREVVEKADCGIVHFIPYGSFTSYDAERNNLMLLAYNRPGGMNGEERLVGKTSVGFGGHVNSVEDIEAYVTPETTEVTEDGRTVYRVTPSVIDALCRQTLIKELQEELGHDVLDMVIGEMLDSTKAIIMGEGAKSNEVGNLHICFSYVFNMSAHSFMQLVSAAQAEEKEVENLRVINLKAGEFIMSFNTQEELKKLTSELAEGELNMEAWSVMVVGFVLVGIIGVIQNTLTLTDLLVLSQEKINQVNQASLAQESASGDDSQVTETAAVVEETAEQG